MDYYNKKMTSIMDRIYAPVNESTLSRGKALDHISDTDRKKIYSAFHRHPELGGNKKLENKEKALNIINDELQSCGFYLELVTGDILLGPKGSRLLPFCRSGANAEDDGILIENSRISFNWENLGTWEDPSYEVVVYLS